MYTSLPRWGEAGEGGTQVDRLSGTGVLGDAGRFRGVSYARDWQRGHCRGIPGCRGYHVCPQRLHRRILIGLVI
jgi:hypothetical protein